MILRVCVVMLRPLAGTGKNIDASRLVVKALPHPWIGRLPLGHTIATPDWSTIPAPVDDGAAGHLTGARMASVLLPATNGQSVDLSALSGWTVIYAYPRTGRPGIENPEGWDMIPGARGCTPQSCSFRDRFFELQSLGVNHLFGLSTQDSAYQREAAERLHLPFPILSDEHLEMTRVMQLPTFSVRGMVLLKRFTLVLKAGVVKHVFYPVFPPDQNAQDVVQWLLSNAQPHAS